MSQAPNPKGNMSGYYKRPAKALERGGGFFIPGLEEQYKLKAFCGVLSLGLLALNRLPGYDVLGPQFRSETIGSIAAAFLLGTAAIEAATMSTVQDAAAGEEVIAASWVAKDGDGGEKRLASWAASTLRLGAESVRCAFLWSDDGVRHASGAFPAGGHALEWLEGRGKDGGIAAAAARGLPAVRGAVQAVPSLAERERGGLRATAVKAGDVPILAPLLSSGVDIVALVSDDATRTAWVIGMEGAGGEDLAATTDRLLLILRGAGAAGVAA